MKFSNSNASRNQENKLRDQIETINNLFKEINKKNQKNKSLFEIKPSDRFYEILLDMANLTSETRINYLTYKRNMKYLNKNMKKLNFQLHNV